MMYHTGVRLTRLSFTCIGHQALYFISKQDQSTTFWKCGRDESFIDAWPRLPIFHRGPHDRVAATFGYSELQGSEQYCSDAYTHAYLEMPELDS